MTFCAVIVAFVNILSALLPHKKVSMLTILFLSLITIGSWINCRWTYLYLDSRGFLKKIDTHLPVECVSIYSNNWEILPMFIETRKYKNISFFSSKDENVVEEAGKAICRILKNNDKIILSLVGIPANRHQNYIIVFLNKSERLNSFQKLGTHQFHTSYILYKK
ncbi:MAG: hypothetical protein IJT36_06845 [Alphaproteobacteria bacterium]|nr:hypothetical protein [Alphaproteobacteria bacterium]